MIKGKPVAQWDLGESYANARKRDQRGVRGEGRKKQNDLGAANNKLYAPHSLSL